MKRRTKRQLVLGWAISVDLLLIVTSLGCEMHVKADRKMDERKMADRKMDDREMDDREMADRKMDDREMDDLEMDEDADSADEVPDKTEMIIVVDEWELVQCSPAEAIRCEHTESDLDCRKHLEIALARVDRDCAQPETVEALLNGPLRDFTSHDNGRPASGSGRP